MPRKWSNVELSGAQKLNLGPAGPKRAGGAIGLAEGRREEANFQRQKF